MTFSHTIIFSICILLIQNTLFSQYVNDCKFYKYINIRMIVSRLLIFTISINILYIIFVDFVYNNFLIPNNIAYLMVIILGLTLVILIQLLDIILKLISRVFEVDSRCYMTLIVNNCMQLAFSTLFILDHNSVPSILLYSILTTIGYTFLLCVLYYIIPKFEFLDLPKSVQGIPIELLTISIIAFTLYGLF